MIKSYENFKIELPDNIEFNNEAAKHFDEFMEHIWESPYGVLDNKFGHDIIRCCGTANVGYLDNTHPPVLTIAGFLLLVQNAHILTKEYPQIKDKIAKLLVELGYARYVDDNPKKA